MIRTYLKYLLANLPEKIQTSANIATIIVAVLISTLLLKAHFAPNVFTPTTTILADEVAKGKSMDGRTLGVDWTKNQRTVVLAISTICHFCKDSLPFYRKLGETEKDVEIVAVLPQTVSEGKEYLNGQGVRVDEVRQIPLNTVGVRATPTLLLVNRAGVVTDVWVGKLQPDQEAEVLAAIEKRIPGD